MSNHDKGIEAAALHNHAPIPDDLADAILNYGHECGEFAKDPSHPFGRQRVAKALAVLHVKIAAKVALTKSIPAGGVPLMKGPDTEAEYVEACIAYAEHADTTDDSCEVCQRFLAARAARGTR